MANATLPRTVLVVDDEAGIRELVIRLLEKKGLKVKAASTAEEALTLLAAEKFGCVLTDKNLPGQSGLDLIRKARELQPHCACLLMTGFASMDSVLEALRLGAADYLEKPLPDLKLVVEKISRAMDTQAVAFERAVLADAVKSLTRTVAQKDEQVFAQRTEREMLEMVLDLKVDEATLSLRARIAELEGLLKQTERDHAAIAVELQELLKTLSGLEGTAPEELSARVEAVLAKLA